MTAGREEIARESWDEGGKHAAVLMHLADDDEELPARPGL